MNLIYRSMRQMEYFSYKNFNRLNQLYAQKKDKNQAFKSLMRR